MDKNILSKIDKHELDQIYDHISIPDNPPSLILIAGPCRVGSTALSNAFARSGITSYMQPLKSIRRAIEDNSKVVDWKISGNGGVALVKETFGIKTESEFFDPVDILLNAGYPKNKISLIAIMREPERTLTSWTWMWEEVLMNGFERAYKDTLKMLKNAEKKGIPTICYVHEAIRDNDPLVVIQNLFSKVLQGKANINTKTVNWEHGRNFDNSESVKFFDEPPERFIHAVKTWGGYQYKELIPDLSEDQKKYLKDKNIFEIYNVFRRRCQEDLGIKVLKSLKPSDISDLETKKTSL
jgi:hypothetical protein